MHLYLSVVKRFVSLLLLTLAALTVQGHELSNGYLSLSGKSTKEMVGKLSLTPYDLEIHVKLDANFDGELTAGELAKSAPALQVFYSEILHFVQDGADCPLTFGAVAVDTISDVTLLTLPFQVHCNNRAPVAVHYAGIFAQDDSHKVLVTTVIDGVAGSDVYTTERRTIRVSSNVPATYATIKTFVYQGIIHIWIGIDHILFLIATLLTINLCRQNNQWVGERRVAPVLKEALLLVTAFTLAHSLTLTTTALGWYQPSSRWVEIGIAISVLLTALNNIWPIIHRLGWITFAFGLLHGMGFASVFGELQSSASSPLLAIASFNIGVEIGQLAIVILLVPLLLRLRHFSWYPRRLMPVISSIIALVALNWAFQRW